MLALVARHWFLLTLLLVLGLAWWLPSPLPAAGRNGVKYGLIAAIFLASGLAIRTRELGRGLGHWRLHALIQACSFVLAVAICALLDPLWNLLGLPPALRLGLLVLGALPTTVTSCVALTAAAGGNQAAALVNASIGNMAGIIVTPLWILAFTGMAQARPDLPPVVIRLGLLVAAPVLLGQILQPALGQLLTARRRKHLGTSTQVLLLGIVYLTFSRAFTADGAIPSTALPATLLICGLLHGLLLLIPWQLGRWQALRLSREDRICAVICGSQKTMAFGLPVIALVFAGSADLLLISLPILIYHPLQLFVAAALVPRLRRTASPAIARQ